MFKGWTRCEILQSIPNESQNRSWRKRGNLTSTEQTESVLGIDVMETEASSQSVIVRISKMINCIEILRASKFLLPQITTAI